MSQSSGWVKKAVAVACLVGSAGAIYNVNFDVAPLQKQAESVACGASGCRQLTGLERTPFAQRFTFQVQAESAKTMRVECTRGLLLFGDYSCVQKP